MIETSFKCDICDFSVSDRLRHPGWISFKIETSTISVQNESFPEMSAFKLKPNDGDKDFCSLSCLIKWVKSTFG